MAKIEVDEAEYNRMVALQGVASKIVANPSARKMLEQAHKLVDPNAPTPITPPVWRAVLRAPDAIPARRLSVLANTVAVIDGTVSATPIPAASSGPTMTA